MFLQPSLSAKAGGVIAGPPLTYSTNMYERVRLLAEVNLKRETAATLVLRKVLDPENPDHQAVIDSSQPPDDKRKVGMSQQMPQLQADPQVTLPEALRGGSSQKPCKVIRLSSQSLCQHPWAQAGHLDVIDLT